MVISRQTPLGRQRCEGRRGECRQWRCAHMYIPMYVCMPGYMWLFICDELCKVSSCIVPKWRNSVAVLALDCTYLRSEHDHSPQVHILPISEIQSSGPSATAFVDIRSDDRNPSPTVAHETFYPPNQSHAAASPPSKAAPCSFHLISSHLASPVIISPHISQYTCTYIGIPLPFSHFPDG